MFEVFSAVIAIISEIAAGAAKVVAKREVRRRMMNVARTMTSDLGERMLEARRLVTTV